MNEIEKVQDFLFYNSEDGSVKVQVLVDAETRNHLGDKSPQGIYGERIRASERLFYQKLTDIFIFKT